MITHMYASDGHCVIDDERIAIITVLKKFNFYSTLVYSLNSSSLYVEFSFMY